MIGRRAARCTACCSSIWRNWVSRSGCALPRSRSFRFAFTDTVAALTGGPPSAGWQHAQPRPNRCAQVPQAAADPFLVAHRVPSRLWPDQRFQRGLDQRIPFSTGGRPPPVWRTRSGGRSANSAPSSPRPRWIVLGSKWFVRQVRWSCLKASQTRN